MARDGARGHELKTRERRLFLAFCEDGERGCFELGPLLRPLPTPGSSLSVLVVDCFGASCIDAASLERIWRYLRLEYSINGKRSSS